MLFLNQIFSFLWPECDPGCCPWENATSSEWICLAHTVRSGWQVAIRQRSIESLLVNFPVSLPRWCSNFLWPRVALPQIPSLTELPRTLEIQAALNQNFNWKKTKFKLMTGSHRLSKLTLLLPWAAGFTDTTRVYFLLTSRSLSPVPEDSTVGSCLSLCLFSWAVLSL